MRNPLNRRIFLGKSAVLAAGLAAGAFTPASLAAQQKVISKAIFLRDNDKMLNDDALQTLLVGNTMEGVTFKGSQYLMYLADNRDVEKKLTDGRHEIGKWSIKNDKLTVNFPTLAQGDKFSLEVHASANGLLYKGWSPDSGRWTWFVVEEGRASEVRPQQGRILKMRTFFTNEVS